MPQSDKPFVIEEGQSCDNVTQMSHKCHTVVPQVSQECHTDIDKDIDIDIEKKKETYVSKEKEFPEKRFEEKVIDKKFSNMLYLDKWKERSI